MQVAMAQGLYLMNHVNHEMWHYIKKAGGKHISSWFCVSTTNSCRSLSSFLPIVFYDIFEKK
jgi:hypothetical protein